MSGFPTIYDFLEYLGFVRGFPAAIIVLLTASFILIVRDWRWSLLAILIQYLIVGLLFADVLAPHLSFMKVVIGIFICLTLYVTARQVNWGLLPEDVTREEALRLGKLRILRFGPYMLPTDTPFRIFLALVVIVSVWTLTNRPSFHLPVVPHNVNFAILVMIGMGLVTLSATSEPYKAGLGVLTFITGFELFYSAVDQSLNSLLIFAITNIAITLVVTYLAQLRHLFPALYD